MKVLLLADIGRTDYGFYHVGDEAMFFETYRWYQKYYPKIDLGCLTRSKSHHNLKISEYLHLAYSNDSNKSRGYFVRLMIKIIFRKYFGINYCSNKENIFLNNILKYQVLHFTGGGNLYNICVPWLWYTYFLIFVFFIYHKRIILTSQTIGPISGIDRLGAGLFLNLPILIAIREPNITKNSLRKYLIFHPTLVSMLDVATNLPSKTTYRLQRNNAFRMGISIHDFREHGELIIELVEKVLKTVFEKKHIEVILIPHILVNDTKPEWDLWYMRDLEDKLSKYSNLKVVEPDYEKIMSSAFEPAMTIKYFTKQVDIMITTRYHGLIFALSSNTPVITLSSGEYYNRKNINALKFYFGDNFGKYLINLDQLSPDDEVKRKLEFLINNLEGEKNKLLVGNKKLKNNPGLFTLDQLSHWL